MLRLIALLCLSCALRCEDLTVIEPPPRFVWVYPVTGYRVIDGDSVEVRMDLGGEIVRRVTVRIMDLDTPETNRVDQREAARAVTRVVGIWIASQPHIVVEYHADDKYAGRIDGDLVNPDGGQSLSEYLLAQGLCRAYDGGTREPWTADELQGILARAQAIIEAQP